MKISSSYPPNWDIIALTFPQSETHKAIFCFSDTIYNPFNRQITKDMEVHEQIHSERQGDNPSLWWVNYIEDKDFRFEEELLAYAHQVKFVEQNVRDAKLIEWVKEKTAEALSSELYGFNISFNEAKCKIKNLARTL